MARYTIDRLREPSTWAGLAVLLSAIFPAAQAPAWATTLATVLPALVAIAKSDI